MKHPAVIVAWILAATIVASVLIVMAPVYDCIYRDGINPVLCMHGPRHGS